MLDRANDVYRHLNAVRRMAHVAAHLRRLGVRRGQSGTRKRPATGWDALTPSKRRVAELLAERHSNREIADRLVVSRRTVETHVSSALTKLGLNSRREIITRAPRSISP